VSGGLKFRVLTGAGLSILDMASDINVIILYLSRTGEEMYGMYLLGMILACLVIQLMLVYTQNKKKPSKFLKEALIVLTGLKPG
jgi:hypothetical protein